MSNFPASGAPSGAEGKVPGFVDAVQRAKEVNNLFLLVNFNDFALHDDVYLNLVKRTSKIRQIH